MTNKILLTGKNGQLGWELRRTLSTLGDVIAFDRAGLDLTDHESLRNTIRSVKPDLIVNAAAYTAVDLAEKEQNLAMSINAVVPEIMAEEAKKLGATLIHYSTDYVFDGGSETPYTEDQTTSPINIYGKSKLLGEQAIQACDIPYFIFRTSWVYAARGRNFLLTMLKLMQVRNNLSIVCDQHGTPTWSRMIAEITGQILSRNIDTGGFNTEAIKNLRGIYHLTSQGSTTWYDFAQAIHKKSSGIIQAADDLIISPIPSSDYPVPAKRPMSSELSTDKLFETFGIRCTDWEVSLELCLQELKKETDP